MGPRNNNSSSAPLKIAGIYAIVGVLWILYSDRVLAAHVIDSTMLSQLQTYKGWLFILTTAWLLFFLVRHYLADNQQERRSLEESERYNRALFEQSPVGLALCRMDGSLIDVNESYARIIGRTVDETLRLTYWEITPEKFAAQEQQQLESLRTTGRYGPYEKEYIHKDGNLVPVRLQGLLISRGGEQFIWSSVEDITERKRTELILASEKQVLEMVSQGVALPEVLEKIVLNIESLSLDTIASILLLDPDGLHVHYGAAPHLPEAYNRALEGAAIGPKAGSCGTAMHRRESVIVSDIETDPLWSDYRELAMTYGLRACWSTPIIGSEGTVLGSFAMYYREPRSPMKEDFELIARTTHVAAIAIERRRAEAEVKRSEERLRSVIDGLGQEMFVGLLTPDGRVLEANQPALSAAGLKLEDIINKPVEETYWFSYSESVKNQLRYAVEMAAGGKPSRFDVEIRVGENQFIILDFSMQPLRDETGRIVFLIPSALVVTERKRAEEELRIANEELLAINRLISTTTTTTIGVKEILEKVMDEALTITGLEGGTICMVTPDNTLHLAAHRATSEATIIDLTTNEIKVGDCLCGECARDHKPLILRDREAVLTFSTREATRGEDIRFHAAFPLIIGDRCLGVLCVFTRTDKKPAERRLKLLETITSQVAIAVDNAQMFEEISQHATILENRVKERTVELETKMAEIERMNRLFVGREMRMVELKERMKELEKQIGAGSKGQG